MAKLGKPWSVMELEDLERGLRLGVSIEVIADFITRDADEVWQKADELGVLPPWKRAAREGLMPTVGSSHRGRTVYERETPAKGN
jgi:hypothetical protein